MMIKFRISAHLLTILSGRVLALLLAGLVLGQAGATEKASAQVNNPSRVSVEAELKKGLGDALRATLNYHPAVRGKLAEVSAQDGLVQSAKAGRYPSLSANAQTLETGDTTGTLRVRQPLWAFGRIDTAIDAAEAQSLAEEVLLVQVQRDLIEQTAVAYTNNQSLVKRIAIASDNVAAHRRLLERVQRRERGQLASTADVNLARSRMIRAQGELYRLQGELQTAQTELRSLTQIKVGVAPELADEFLVLPPLVEIQHLAQTRNADLLVKQAQAEVAQWAVKTTQLQDTPTVYLQVDQELLDTPDAFRDRTRVGLVFEARTEGLGFASSGKSASAEARYQAALYDRDSVRNEVVRELETLLTTRSVQKRLRGSQLAALQAAEETLGSFERQYEQGRKTWIEVLNQQREVAGVRQQLAQIERDWQLSTLRIAALIGHLDAQAGLDI